MIQFLRKVKRIVDRVIFEIDSFFVRIFYRSRLLSNIYYAIFSRRFSREHRAVLAGKAKYINDIKSDRSSYYLLVRNVHRLEKGLLMKPRRPIFGKNYIEETVASFKKVWLTTSEIDNKQLYWFRDVLNKYFVETGQDKLIEAQKKIFYSVLERKSLLPDTSIKSIPYKKRTEIDITYDEFFDLTRKRRSVRWFLDKRVPRELIDKAILAASQAPSACNRQPFHYKIIDDPEILSKLVKLPMGTVGYSHNIKTFIVVVGNLDAYYSERDRHLIYIDASLANMNLMLALETLGLSSCPINWPDIEKREKKMDRLLGLKLHQRPIMCLAVGYPDPEGMIACSEKRSLNEIRSYNL
ncbi:nitroreductase family protein [Gracilimonas amylolytica]|uniref:nitroreductase family protein n=1 Tax=Gracilimonas amylolytica TaxID=1749045 RepID=UPI000CD84408|nr:nitroreductase family protein [Gracilimonas amylolytica]